MPKLTVSTAIDAFTFMRDQETTTLHTYIHLTTDSARPKILSVGEEPIGNQHSVRIDLFAQSDICLVSAVREELIAAFLRYAFRQLAGRRWLVRPIVRFRGTGQLRPVLGYEVNKILSNCAFQAGADEIHFDI